MSKVVLVCPRDPARVPEFADKLRRLNSRLLPDNLTPNPPSIVTHEGVVTAVYNPVSLVRREGASVCLGTMLSPAADWHQPGAELPDGNYALYRADAQTVELVTDILASRTVWYAQTDEMFIASSSQRAIVALLGDFQFNQAVIPWMLSAGALGPDHSWDKRLRYLRSDSRLTLNRQTWELSVQTREIRFALLPMSEAEHTARFREALTGVFSRLDLDYSRWVLMLSGGKDSRLLLSLLQQPGNMRCVTNGLRAALDDPESDACISRQVAGRFGASHRYVETDLPDSMTVEAVLERYLVAGEGRTDHISGYMDGLRQWETLAREGVEGVARADQNFGLPAVYTAYDARRIFGMYLLADYSNLGDCRRFDLPEQVIPDYLLPHPGEPPLLWSDRVYGSFRYPVILAGLNDLKSPYLEPFNPLIITSLVRLARTLPDSLRYRKRNVLELVAERVPGIPYATRLATQDRKSIVHLPQVVALLRAELRSQTAALLFSERLIDFLSPRIEEAPDHPPRNLRHFWLKKLLPPRAVSLIRNRYQPIDYNTMALRVYIVCRMARMLSADAAALKDEP